MKRIPWRHLAIAAALGGATYFACWAAWPAAKPRKTLRFAEFDQHGLSQQIQLSPDGALIGIGLTNTNTQIHTWAVCRTSDGAVLSIRPSERIAFSPKGDSYALVSDFRVDIFDGESGKVIADQMSREFICGASYGPDGVLYVLNLAWGSATLRRFTGNEIIEKAFSESLDVTESIGKWALARNEQGLEVWDIVAARRVGSLPAITGVNQFAVSADGGTVLVCPQDKPAVVHDLKAGGISEMPFSGWNYYRAQLSPDGHLAAGAFRETKQPAAQSPPWFQKVRDFIGLPKPAKDQRRGISLYDTKRGAKVAFFEGAVAPTFSEDGKTLALLKRNGHVELWGLPLRSTVPYWILISTTAALSFFLILRWAHRRRQARHFKATPPAVSA